MDAIVVIAASAGGLEPLRRVITALPASCTAAVFVVMHIGSQPSVLPLLLGRIGGLPVAFAEDGDLIEPGHIYVAPPNRHMLLDANRIRLNRGRKVNHARPAADPLFISAAKAHGERVIGIVLSGEGSDGADGLRTIKAHGGTVVVQQPDDAVVAAMPFAALLKDHPDACVPVPEVARLVASFCSVAERLRLIATAAGSSEGR